MNNTLIKRLVAFAVLMESGEGIESKSSSYVLEKWHLCMTVGEKGLKGLMDPQNRDKYDAWLKEWIV